MEFLRKCAWVSDIIVIAFQKSVVSPREFRCDQKKKGNNI